MNTALMTPAASTASGHPERLEGRRLGLRPGTVWALSCLSVDAGMLVFAAAVTAIGSSVTGIASPPAVWMAAFAVLCFLLYHRRGLYRPRFRLRALDDVRGVAIATTIAAMAILSLRALLGNSQDILAESFRPWAFAVVYVA